MTPSELVKAYNDHLHNNVISLTNSADPDAYPNSLRPFLQEDVVLSEPASLPWGGEWPGLHGFLDEAKAFFSGMYSTHDLKDVEYSYHQCGNDVVYRNFAMQVISRENPESTYLWRGVERYDMAGGKCIFLDVFYKDTAGLLKFLGHSL